MGTKYFFNCSKKDETTAETNLVLESAHSNQRVKSPKNDKKCPEPEQKKQKLSNQELFYEKKKQRKKSDEVSDVNKEISLENDINKEHSPIQEKSELSEKKTITFGKKYAI